MSDVSSLSDTIIPKSDQLNADQLLSGPMTITVTGVRRGNDEQPVVINYEGDNGRPYKPCKSMRKVLIFAWGDDGREWVGRSMTLFNDPNVKYGGVKVGGIRISHMSHIQSDIALSLAVTRGKKEPTMIKKLAGAPAAAKQAKPEPSGPSDADVKASKRALMAEAEQGMDALKAAWGATAADMRKAISPDGKCPEALKEIATKADAEAAAKAEAERLAEEQRRAEEEAAEAATSKAAAEQQATDEINEDDMF